MEVQFNSTDSMLLRGIKTLHYIYKTSGKESHTFVDVDTVVRSERLCGTLAWNGRGVGSNPDLGAVIPIFFSPHKTGYVCTMTCLICKLCAVWLLNLPCVCTVEPVIT